MTSHVHYGDLPGVSPKCIPLDEHNRAVHSPLLRHINLSQRVAHVAPRRPTLSHELQLEEDHGQELGTREGLHFYRNYAY